MPSSALILRVLFDFFTMLPFCISASKFVSRLFLSVKVYVPSFSAETALAFASDFNLYAKEGDFECDLINASYSS